ALLINSKAGVLLYGTAELAVVAGSHRLANVEPVTKLTDIRGTAFIRRDTPEGWFELDSTRVDRPGRVDKILNPYVNTQDAAACADRKSTRLNSSHVKISYAVFCLKKKTKAYCTNTA